jgi:micrococcal nuclease
MRVLRNPVLVVYIALTLLGLVTLADWIDPPPGRVGCRIAYVYDGDTVDLVCGVTHQTVRLTGLDAPETKEPGCPEEKALGDGATKRLRALVKAGRKFRYWEEGHDRFGRELVHIWIDGRDVADVLVAEGLATDYDGGARVNWCDRIRG